MKVEDSRDGLVDIWTLAEFREGVWTCDDKTIDRIVAGETILIGFSFVSYQRTELEFDEIETLGELCQHLNELDERGQSAAETLDLSSLPNFGGPTPYDTSEIFSWDHTGLLYSDGDCGKWEISDRETLALDYFAGDTLAIYRYDTGADLRVATAQEALAYLRELGNNWVGPGAVDGGPYGYDFTVYMI